jgi:predicted nuclease of restriction endonuclease-like RecB superfamily
VAVLTGELVRVRRVGDQIVPRYLSRRERGELCAVAAELGATLAGSLGATREALGLALGAVEHRPADAKIVAGLRKLLLDRCEFAAPAGLDPELVRQTVFLAATAARRALGPTERFEREGVLREAAAALAVSPEELEPRLFADLEDAERLVSVRPLEAEALLDRYDLALAQAVLLHATRVSVELEDEAPAQVRTLFRAARFHQLIHRVHAREPGGYRIELDGPLSLFSAVQRYGLRLALFLPSVLACERWRLEAELCWGSARQPLEFRLAPEQGLVPGTRTRRPPPLAPELAELVERFRALESLWWVARSESIFAQPGEPACVPDLVFTHGGTGEQVYLEAFGFWSRAAVWQRIETLRRGFPARIILAVGKQLRVSEELLDENEAGELYVYRTKPSARAILERLERRS